MGYYYMSNINDFDNVDSPNKSYQQVGVCTTTNINDNLTPDDGVITFKESNINQNANFIMIRAHDDNDLLVQLYPSNYGVYIPAGELWSVDSLNEIKKIIVRKIISISTNTNGERISNGAISSGKIQWVIGYK